MQMTQDQYQAKKEINYWLLSDEPEHILSGIGGAGKSWLVDLIISELRQLEQKGKILNIKTVTSAEVTATTNKAAGVLNNAVTIQKRLKLRMSYNFKTGKKFMVKSNASQPIYNTLLVIDEASMVGARLLKQIRELTVNCKILFVGDHCQLLPVGEETSSVFAEDIEVSHLREPVRCTIPDIQLLNAQLRESVETGIFKPIQPSDNVHFVYGQVAEDTLKSLYHADLEPDEVKILTYANKTAIGYDAYIKKHLGKTSGWEVGDLALINNSIRLSKSLFTSVGSTYVIEDISNELEYKGVAYRIFKLNGYRVYVPTNWNQYVQILNRLAKNADWQTHIEMSELFADLRDAYASTCHAAQGSSYGTVFINLTELSTCRSAETFARLLYVACSRAKHKIYFTGKLAKKYGG